MRVIFIISYLLLPLPVNAVSSKQAGALLDTWSSVRKESVLTRLEGKDLRSSLLKAIDFATGDTTVRWVLSNPIAKTTREALINYVSYLRRNRIANVQDSQEGPNWWIEITPY